MGNKQIKDMPLKEGISGNEDILIQDEGVTKRIKTEDLISDLSVYYTKSEVDDKISDVEKSGNHSLYTATASIKTSGTMIRYRDGAIVNDTRYSTSDLYEVNEGDIIKIEQTASSTGAAVVALYDANIVFVETLVRGAGSSYINTEVVISQKGYVRFTFHKPERPDDLELFTIRSKAYIELEKQLIKTSNIESKVLYGKTMNIIGDSLVANNNWHKTDGDGIEPYIYTWHYLIAQKYNMVYNNYGINGNGIVGECNGTVPMMTRYSNMSSDADYVIVVGGRNDYNYQVDIDTFKNGLHTLCSGLIDKYPNSTIAFFTAWVIDESEDKQIKQKDYVDVIIEVCSDYSISVYDSYRQSGMFFNNSNFRTIYAQSPSDRSHLNDLGHIKFKNKAENFLLSL